MKTRWIAALCLASGLAAAEPGVAVRDATLRSEPYDDAPASGALKAQTAVEILGRQGAWLQVRGAAGGGWVRLLSVRSAGSGRAGESGLSQAFNVARAGSSGTAVATGVRGLSKEQIQNASPNYAELDRLDGYAASEAQARVLASQPPALAEAGVGYLDSADGR